MRKIIVLLVLVAFGCSKEDNQSFNYTISGIIKSQAIPVENVEVSLDNLIQFSTTTDANGYFEITNVSPGNYNLEAKKGIETGSFSTNSERVVVSNGNVNLNEIQLPEPVVLNEPLIVSSIDGNTVTLNWSQYTGDDFREYKLYKHDTSGIDENTAELIHVSTISNELEFTLQLPHNSNTYFRVFVLDEFGLLGGSNIVNASIGSYAYNEEITVNTTNEYYLNPDEEQTLYFDAEQGEAYAIQWLDNIADNNYSAASLVVSAYNQDATNYYFQNERLIPMTGSPMPIIAPANERVYLSLKGDDTNIPVSGTYGIKITKLTSSSYNLDTNYSVGMDLGETKLLDFNTEANKNYKITLISTVPYGAYGDGIQTHFSLFKESSSTFLNYKQPLTNLCCSPVIEYNFNSSINQKIYIIFDGAYWITPNNIDLIVEEI